MKLYGLALKFKEICYLFCENFILKMMKKESVFKKVPSNVDIFVINMLYIKGWPGGGESTNLKFKKPRSSLRAFQNRERFLRVKGINYNYGSPFYYFY